MYCWICCGLYQSGSATFSNRIMSCLNFGHVEIRICCRFAAACFTSGWASSHIKRLRPGQGTLHWILLTRQRYKVCRLRKRVSEFFLTDPRSASAALSGSEGMELKVQVLRPNSTRAFKTVVICTSQTLRLSRFIWYHATKSPQLGWFLSYFFTEPVVWKDIGKNAWSGNRIVVSTNVYSLSAYFYPHLFAIATFWLVGIGVSTTWPCFVFRPWGSHPHHTSSQDVDQNEGDNPWISTFWTVCFPLANTWSFAVRKYPLKALRPKFVCYQVQAKHRLQNRYSATSLARKAANWLRLRRKPMTAAAGFCMGAKAWKTIPGTQECVFALIFSTKRKIRQLRRSIFLPWQKVSVESRALLRRSERI